MMKIISLGWGVQSFALAAMAALGELPSIAAAIHADTTHEASGTYAFAKRWAPWLEQHGVRVVTVDDRSSADRVWQGEMIPAFRGTGQALRTCTQRWKVAPVRRWLQANRQGQPVEQWLGISLDEVTRMRDSNVQYITNRYPLIDLRMSRLDCRNWLERHGLEIPPRSACVFCPFHNQAEWRALRDGGNGDWQKAVDIDERIRKARPPYDLYVHQARIPLTDVDLRTQEDHGQLSLWNAECSGMCGV